MWRGEMGETAKLNLSPLKSYDRKGRSLPLKHHFAGTVKLWGVCIRKQDPRSLDDFFRERCV